MAKHTIIDWQRDGLMVAVGHGHGASTALEKLSVQPIGLTEDQQDTLPTNGDATQALVRAVDELGLRKSDVIVVASRELVEVRTLLVPRVDPHELPDVIRFQAQRQLANMGDNWALDYVLLPDDPGQEMQTALVGVISPATLQEMEAACTAAGVQLIHLALRPIEIARFAATSGQLPSSGTCVVICLSASQAELLILNNGSIVQVRVTKLPAEPARLTSSLGGDLRRSLMAASSHLANQPLSGALLFADPQLAKQVEPTINEILGCNVVVMDPARKLPSDLSGRSELACSSANRLAGILGAANFTTAESRTQIDFKNTKKRPPPKSRKGLYILGAVATALLAGAGFSWWTSANRMLDEDLAFYQKEVESKKELESINRQRVTDLQEIDKFLKGTPNWLEELAYIAENLPPSEKVLIGEPSFSVLPDGSGRINLPVALDSQSTISIFEESLSDENHSVATKSIAQLDQPTELYKWRVEQSITVRNSGWDLVAQLDSTRPSGRTNQVQPESAGKASTDNAAQPATEPTPIPDDDKQASSDDDLATAGSGDV